MKGRIVIVCYTHDDRHPDGTPVYQARDVIIDVDDYGQATKILRGLEITARGLLNRDDELIKNMLEDGTIKLRGSQ